MSGFMPHLIPRHRQGKWSMISAFIGSIVWIASLVLGQQGHVALGTIEQLFLFAPLIIVPLGFLLAQALDQQGWNRYLLQLACRLQPFAGFLVVVSFWLTSGVLAALLTLPWLLVSGLVGLVGFRGLLRTGFDYMEEVCFNASLLYLTVGAVWLVLSRFGASPLGFEEPVVLLTAVHFHYTGFATALIAGAVGHRLRAIHRLDALFRVVAVGVVGGPPLIALGFVFSPFLKVTAVIWLAASLTALCIVFIIVLPTIRHRHAQVLLAISALSILVGMALVGVYAVGEFAGHLWLSIPHMARTHGAINAFGFTLCGLLAWIIEGSES